MTKIFKTKEAMLNMTFNYRPSGSGELYKHLISIRDENARLHFLCSGQPNTAQFEDQVSREVFWRPRVGGVIISSTEEFKKYPTPTGAYREAVRIKRAMEAQLKEYTDAIEQGGITNYLVHTHFIGKVAAL